MNKRTTHLHKYERAVLGKNNYVVFRCILPNCAHYISKELVKGKICLCNRCNEPMIMDTRASNMQKPHCKPCIRPNDDVAALAELFK
jgi:formylmethanofuran dehydrogenase subunit E